VQRGFNAIGIIVFSLGLGFILASLMAYAVSSRLGLFQRRTAADSGNA
jgi:hypothetical protein